jgi:hypothetical protein
MHILFVHASISFGNVLENAQDSSTLLQNEGTTKDPLPDSLDEINHYWSRLLCRGPQALGKASKAFGKAFAEHSSRQSALSKNLIGKGFFAESPTLGKARNKKMRKKNFVQNSRLRGQRDSNS